MNPHELLSDFLSTHPDFPESIEKYLALPDPEYMKSWDKRCATPSTVVWGGFSLNMDYLEWDANLEYYTSLYDWDKSGKRILTVYKSNPVKKLKINDLPDLFCKCVFVENETHLPDGNKSEGFFARLDNSTGETSINLIFVKKEGYAYYQLLTEDNENIDFKKSAEFTLEKDYSTDKRIDQKTSDTVLSFLKRSASLLVEALKQLDVNYYIIT